MRKIGYVHDYEELQRITALLAEKGIPTYAREAFPSKLARRWLVFVCLDSQADDAALVLRDPEHIPALAVNVDTFNRAAYTRNLDVLVKWSVVGAIVAIATFCSLLYFLSGEA